MTAVEKIRKKAWKLLWSSLAALPVLFVLSILFPAWDPLWIVAGMLAILGVMAAVEELMNVSTIERHEKLKEEEGV